MWIAIHMLGPQPDHGQQLDDPLALLQEAMSEIVHFQRATQNLHDRLTRIERAVGVLKDNLYGFPQLVDL
jgi:Tfp pilus assembly protein PilN